MGASIFLFWQLYGDVSPLWWLVIGRKLGATGIREPDGWFMSCLSFIDCVGLLWDLNTILMGVVKMRAMSRCRRGVSRINWLRPPNLALSPSSPLAAFYPSEFSRYVFLTPPLPSRWWRRAWGPGLPPEVGTPLDPKGTLGIPPVSERSLTLGRGFTARRDGDASLGFRSAFQKWTRRRESAVRRVVTTGVAVHTEGTVGARSWW